MRMSAGTSSTRSAELCASQPDDQEHDGKLKRILVGAYYFWNHTFSNSMQDVSHAIRTRERSLLVTADIDVKEREAP